MNDLLEICGLIVSTRIGIHAWEQRILQPLELDIRIPLDLSQFQHRLSDTLDYDAICQAVIALLENGSFGLIESVAEHVATLLREQFHVQTATITVNKPHAVKQAKGIKITRTFSDLQAG